MATKVLVPLLGEGVEEVTVSKWLKREGESIRELEPLLEVNTDKVDTEIPAPATGTLLKIIASEGVPARVGEVLALIGHPGEPIIEGESEQRPAATLSTSKTQARPADGGTARPATHTTGFVSPVVARMAAENRIDLSRVQGTGLNGRITKNDVLGFMRTGSGPTTAGAARAGQLRHDDQLIPHTTIRRQIAEHMVLSQKTSPHVLSVMEADMGQVAAHRQVNRDAFERQGVNLTFTAYFIAAIARGLKAFPIVNSSWTDEGLLVHGAINVGMATSLGEEGLIVPVIKGADRLSLVELARIVNDLATRARTHKLQPDDVRGGTFTLTNHGTGGSLLAMPIINQPQCAILGTGSIQKRAVVITDAKGADAIAVRPMVYLSLVFDHRILDGAGADAFLGKVKEALETWS